MTNQRKQLPSLDYLNECFELDREGNLLWKRRPNHHFNTKRQSSTSNKVAGKKSW